jgi:CRP/FNR family transcriptional regulator, cyclic AMP receptor protein
MTRPKRSEMPTESESLDSRFPLRHDILSALPDPAQSLLLREAKRMSLRKGQVLFRRGDRSDSAYCIRQGIIKISVISPAGEQRIVALQAGGSTVGDLALIDGKPRSTTAEAMTDCDLLIVTRSAFQAELVAHPEIHPQISVLLTERVRALVEEFAQAVFLPMRARVARALLRLAELVGEPAGTDLLGIDHAIGQGDIAAMAGVTRESVNRTLTEWRSEGLLFSSQRHRVVLNVRRLLDEAARHE